MLLIGLFAMPLLLVAQSITIDQLFFNAGEPQTPQGEFIRYIRGGFLTSGNYYQFFSSDEAVKHMEAATLSVFRLSLSQFPQQSVPLPSYVVTLGILDNLGALQGEINGRTESAVFADLGSISGAYMLPLMDYGAFLSAGADSSFSLRTRNGSTLSGATSISVSGGENDDFRWIKLFPRKGYDTMGIMLRIS